MKKLITVISITGMFIAGAAIAHPHHQWNGHNPENQQYRQHIPYHGKMFRSDDGYRMFRGHGKMFRGHRMYRGHNQRIMNVDFGYNCPQGLSPEQRSERQKDNRSKRIQK